MLHLIVPVRFDCSHKLNLFFDMQDLAHTLRTRLADHGRFVAPKRPQHAFAVEHYAGRVTYSSELLLEKNKVPTSMKISTICCFAQNE